MTTERSPPWCTPSWQAVKDQACHTSIPRRYLAGIVWLKLVMQTCSILRSASIPEQKSNTNPKGKPNMPFWI